MIVTKCFRSSVAGVLPTRPDHLERPHPSRFAGSHARFEEVMTRHAEAVASGSPTYRDPVSGYQVFTSAFLAGRGTCCDTGCRHCPYVGADGGAARAGGAG